MKSFNFVCAFSEIVSLKYLFAILRDNGTYRTAYLDSFSNPKEKFIEKF